MRPALAALLLASASAFAAEADVPRAAPRGVALGEDWRYREEAPLLWAKGLVLRTFTDFAAIPSSLPDERLAEWVPSAVVTAVTLGALVPLNGRSADARVQDAIHAWRGANCANAPEVSSSCPSDRPSGFHLWTDTTNVVFEGVQVSTPIILILAGALAGQPDLVEVGTLAVEAYSVALLSHLAIKVLVGREAVLSRQGGGEFFGPSIAYFPDGFPSGHAAGLFALIGTYATYYDEVWLQVALFGAGAVLAVGLVVDDYHFATETLFGATMGYFIGRWVVRHRSTRFIDGDDRRTVRLVAVAPLTLKDGVGAAALFRF